MLDRGMVQADELGLGVVTTADGALVNAELQASRWLYLIGPLRKAQLWESTAVPELRVMAEKLGRKLLDELSVRPAARADEAAVAHRWDEPKPADLGGGDDDRDAVPVYIGEYI